MLGNWEYSRQDGLLYFLRSLYRFVRLFVVKLLGLFYKVKVYNKNNLPAEGGYVIACMHTGWIDILNLGVSIYPKPIHVMAKK